jgi:hypothetical protein
MGRSLGELRMTGDIGASLKDQKGKARLSSYGEREGKQPPRRPGANWDPEEGSKEKMRPRLA